MNFVSTANPAPRAARHRTPPSALARARRGFTMLEVLIAMTIVMAFLASAYASYVQITKTHQLGEVRVEALRNARAPLTSLTDEIKDINRQGADFLLIGLNDTRTYGDGIDNNFDGAIDQDVVDGFNDAAAPGTPPGAGQDRHAIIGNGLLERQLQAGQYDLGDAGVDEDVRFGNDAVIFRIFPNAGIADFQLKTVTYAVDSFDGEQNVLLRQVLIERDGQQPLIGLAPIAFNVLGFDVLYWNPNAEPRDQYWVTSWDSSEVENFELPRLPLPASLYVRVTVRADPLPESETPPGSPVKTVTLSTVINIEETIGDVLFPRPLL